MRLNEINSIPNPVASNPFDSRFILGNASVITASHKIDFSDKVEFGKRVILGGRNSSLWTHNRQSTAQIYIGDYSYIGSEIRIAPGGRIPAKCIVGIGSVITKQFTEDIRRFESKMHWQKNHKKIDCLMISRHKIFLQTH